MYDAKLLRMRLGHLRRVLAVGEPGRLMDAVQADLIRNLANMTNPCTSEPKTLGSIMCAPVIIATVPAVSLYKEQVEATRSVLLAEN